MATTEPFRFEVKNYPEEAFRKLLLLRYEENLQDVVLISKEDGARVSCNRIILAMASPFFNAMFTLPMVESQQKEISLGEVYGDQLLSLVDFCYTGTIEIRNVSDAQKLAKAARFLQLDDAVNLCTDFLKRNLKPSNFFSIYAVADELYLKDLKILTEDYIDKYFGDITHEPEFLELPLERFAQLVARDELLVKSEEVVFESLISWVEHDRSDRLQHFHTLLKLIRVHSLSSEYYLKKFRPLCAEYGCQPLPLHTQQQDCICTEKYCPMDQKWTSIGKMIPKRESFGAVILNDTLIILGGRFSSNRLRSVIGYNLSTTSSKTLAPMWVARYNFGVAVMDGLLYVVSGNTQNSVERYDPVENTWTMVASITEGRSNLQVAALDGRLYASGGRNDTIANSAHDCYDPQTNEWTPRRRMLEPRFRHGVAIHDGFVYVVGGHNGRHHLKTMERYDPRIDKWSRICSLAAPRRSVICNTFGNILFAMRPVIVDGHGFNFFDEYHFEKQKWREVKPLRELRYNFKALLSWEIKICMRRDDSLENQCQEFEKLKVDD